MKKEKDTSAQEIASGVLLACSTWLVAGVWIAIVGVERIVHRASGGDLAINFLQGWIEIAIGAFALSRARLIGESWNKPHGLVTQLMTVGLLVLIVVKPLLVFATQTCLKLSGQVVNDQVYRQNVFRLVLVAAMFVPATWLADWILKINRADHNGRKKNSR